MIKTVAVLGIVVAFGLFLFSVLPPTAQPNGHIDKHPRAAWLVSPETQFACKYYSPTKRTWLFLEWDPNEGECPPVFGGVVITAAGGLLVTAFFAKLASWLSALGRYGYERSDD